MIISIFILVQGCSSSNKIKLIQPAYQIWVYYSNLMNQSKLPTNNYDDAFQIQCKFDRSSATYKPDEVVSGSVCLIHSDRNNFKFDIEALWIDVWGGAVAQNRQGKPQIQQVIKKTNPITIINIPELMLAKSKTITHQTKIPFRFKLQNSEHRYLQTYIGVYISVSYTIRVHFKVSSLRKIQQEVPFYIQVPKAGRQTIQNFVYPKKKNFMVVSSDIKGDKNKVPVFKIRGELTSEIVFFSQDLHGCIVVDLADSPIRSIDLQMLRVQKIENEYKSLNEKTQIQLIQICDGNITRNLDIPLYMILPRYYSCPSIKYLWCNVNFEVNLQIIFKDGYKVTVNIPLKLIRS